MTPDLHPKSTNLNQSLNSNLVQRQAKLQNTSKSFKNQNLVLQIAGNNAHHGNQAMSPSDFDNGQEDVNMMNIPREGNAEQLNKSVKLTLSSKK